MVIISPIPLQKRVKMICVERVLACLCLVVLCGCITHKSNVAIQLAEPFECNKPVFVFCGNLQTNWTEDYLGVAQYQMKTISAGENVSITFRIDFYISTMPSVLPKNALLAMVRGANGDYILLGRDASRSIADDIPVNRKIWKKMCSKGKFIPLRQAWLREDKAIALVQRELGIAENCRSLFRVTSQRYEIGWLIGVEPKGDEIIVGSHTVVGVGDDGKVKFVSRGL